MHTTDCMGSFDYYFTANEILRRGLKESKMERAMITKMDVRNTILTISEEYSIRLTPSEFEILVDDYWNRYINNIDISGLIQLSENVKRRK